jgi:malonyl-CoA/methylmalonyl-CoA synthetase
VEIRITNADNDKDILLEAKGEFNKGYWSSEGEEKATIQIKPGATSDAEIIGSLQVRGPNVFGEYYKRPEATKGSFTNDGWFLTGDTVCYDPTVNSFKVMGRNSVDIIKSKGYKVSALEIETKMLENATIDDCAVLGVPDEVLGQKIIALVVFKSTDSQSEELIPSLKKWCEQKFANYSMPSVKVVSKIPRNQMGKVNKADLVKDIIKAMQTTQANTPVK